MVEDIHMSMLNWSIEFAKTLDNREMFGVTIKVALK